MKHISHALVALMLTLTLLMGGVVRAEAPEEAPVDRIMADFCAVTEGEAQMYDALLWAISYIERYDQSRTWEDLMLARTAACTAWKAIATMETPAFRGTAEDYKAVMRDGMDMAHVEIMAQDFEICRTMLANTTLNLIYAVMQNVYETRGWSISLRHAAVVREGCEDELLYSACTVDWTLLELNDASRTERIGALLAADCPSVATRRAGEPVDQASLEGTAGALRDRISDRQLTALSEILGQETALIDAYADALENGDGMAALGDPIAIAGLPPILPLPGWEDLLNAEYVYYWNEGDGIRLPEAGEALEAAPDGCVITVRNVTRSAVERYRDLLSRNPGIVPLNEPAAEGGLKLMYSVSDSQLVLDWNDGTLVVYMLQNPVCLAPAWYRGA